MAKKIYDEVLQQEVLVQEEITPDIGEEHPHDDVAIELQVEEGDIDAD